MSKKTDQKDEKIYAEIARERLPGMDPELAKAVTRSAVEIHVNKMVGHEDPVTDNAIAAASSGIDAIGTAGVMGAGAIIGKLIKGKAAVGAVIGAVVAVVGMAVSSLLSVRHSLKAAEEEARHPSAEAMLKSIDLHKAFETDPTKKKQLDTASKQLEAQADPHHWQNKVRAEQHAIPGSPPFIS